MDNPITVAAVLCLALVAGGLSAQPEHINVRDHITRAGNPADHTAAIRAAFAEAAQTGMRVVYFPRGYYTVSEAIDIRHATPVSPGGANITQTNPDQDIFVTPGVWRIVLSGFVFRGGRDHVADAMASEALGAGCAAPCRI